MPHGFVRSKRALVLLLILAMVITPLQQAYAQEVSSGNQEAVAPPSDSSGTNTAPLVSSEPSITDSSSADSTPNTTVLPEGDASANADNIAVTEDAESDSKAPDAAPQKDLSDAAIEKPEAMQGALLSQGSGSPGPGSVAATSFNQSQFKIDKNTGAARVTYPIVIPPGRNKLQPNLDLVYSSQDAEQGSIFGQGWSISIPYVELMNKTGVNTFYGATSTKYYVSSIDGELATTTTPSSYTARTENGSFNDYTFSSNKWTVIDKDGTEYAFGSASSSQQADPNNASNVFRWMLDQVTDKNGNTITYSYFKDSGQIYPSSTVYTNSSSSSGIFQVDFSRTTSTDNTVSYATGFSVNSNYRISEIAAKVNGSWVRKYALGYTVGDNGTAALLQTITASGKNASGTIVTLPASTFSYGTQNAGWTANSVWNPLISFTATSSEDNGSRVADVNGDGLPDIIRSYANASGSYAGAYINNGAGWTASSTWNPPLAFVSSTDAGVRIADVNGDGLPDFVQGYNDGSDHFSSYLNNGAGWDSTSTWNPPVVFVSSSSDTGTRISDVNGDGLPDILTNSSTYINSGTSWILNASWTLPVAFVSSTVDTGARIADINGDGLSDIIQGYNDGSNHLAAYINTGNGWMASTTPVWHPSEVMVVNGADNGVRIMDVNGDGLADVLRGFTDSGGSTILISVRDGHLLLLGTLL
jgi:hypothetical protein